MTFLLLDDGRVQLKVLDVKGTKIMTEVTVGGLLSNNKGINKLGGGLSADALTEKIKKISKPQPVLMLITLLSPSRAAARKIRTTPAVRP